MEELMKELNSIKKYIYQCKRECGRGECVPAAPSESVGETEHPVDADG